MTTLSSGRTFFIHPWPISVDEAKTEKKKVFCVITVLVIATDRMLANFNLITLVKIKVSTNLLRTSAVFLFVKSTYSLRSLVELSKGLSRQSIFSSSLSFGLVVRECTSSINSA